VQPITEAKPPPCGFFHALNQNGTKMTTQLVDWLCAEFCTAIYEYDDFPKVILDKIIRNDEVYFSIERYGYVDYIVCRGTTTAEDVLHDLEAWRAKVTGLGYLAFGVLDSKIAEALVTFGRPRSGGQELANILEAVPQRAYRNVIDGTVDPITKEPPQVPFITPYVDASPFIDIAAPSGPNPKWPWPISLHYSPLYLSGTKQLYEAHTAASVGAHMITPIQFIQQVEGRDGYLGGGKYKAVWDSLGCVYSIGPGLTQGVNRDTCLTQAEVDAALQKELDGVEMAVDSLVTVPLTQNQRTALISFTYNSGVGALESSTLLKVLNQGHYDEVPAQLIRWVHARGAKGPVPGLVNRRNAEIALWRTPDDQGPAPVYDTVNASVPKATIPPTEKASTMAATATIPAPAPAPVTTTTNAINSAFSSATADIKSVWTSISGMLTSVAGAGITGLFVALFPRYTSYILAAISVAVMGINFAAHAYMLVTGIKASNNATFQLAENFLNKVEVALGGQPLTFDDGTGTMAPSSAPTAA
jgi:lysozyme